MNINDGVRLHILKNDIFTTVTAAVLLRQPLKKETASMNVLTAAMLKRGTERLNSQRLINESSENLYGADLESYIMKKGNEQIITLYCEAVDKNNVFENTFDLLLEMLFEPYTENGGFCEKYFEEEKNTAINFLKDKLNDKKTYAREKCIELMYENSESGICADGYEEDFKKADRIKAYNNYREILKTAEIEILINGNISKESKDRITEKCRKRFSFERAFLKNNGIEKKESGGRIKEKNIKMNVSQGRLCIGYKTQINPKENEIYALFIANEILGGGGNSKLFANVREKKGLCYYINSSALRFEGDFIAESGIKEEDLEKTEKSINEEIEKIKKGDFSEKEFKNAAATIKKKYMLINDSASLQLDFFINNIILNTNTEYNKIFEILDSITKEQVCKSIESAKEDSKIFICKG